MSGRSREAFQKCFTVSLEELAQLHQPIVAALVCRDCKTAGQLLREHLEAAQPSDIHEERLSLPKEAERC